MARAPELQDIPFPWAAHTARAPALASSALHEPQAPQPPGVEPSAAPVCSIFADMWRTTAGSGCSTPSGAGNGGSAERNARREPSSRCAAPRPWRLGACNCDAAVVARRSCNGVPGAAAFDGGGAGSGWRRLRRTPLTTQSPKGSAQGQPLAEPVTQASVAPLLPSVGTVSLAPAWHAAEEPFSEARWAADVWRLPQDLAPPARRRRGAAPAPQPTSLRSSSRSAPAAPQGRATCGADQGTASTAHAELRGTTAAPPSPSLPTRGASAYSASTASAADVWPHPSVRDWASYCRAVGLPLASPAPLLLHFPLSLLAALQRADEPLRGALARHLAGASNASESRIEEPEPGTAASSADRGGGGGGYGSHRAHDEGGCDVVTATPREPLEVLYLGEARHMGGGLGCLLAARGRCWSLRLSRLCGCVAAPTNFSKQKENILQGEDFKNF
jgi:hypothetical protein